MPVTKVRKVAKLLPLKNDFFIAILESKTEFKNIF